MTTYITQPVPRLLFSLGGNTHDGLVTAAIGSIYWMRFRDETFENSVKTSS